jgi:hypothetical protein
VDRDQPPGASCRGAVRFRGLESLCRWRRGGREHEAPRRERYAIATRKSGIMRIDETGHDMSTGDANLKDTPGVSIFEHPKRPRTRRTGAFAQASRVNGAQEGAEAHTGRFIQRGPHDEARGRVRRRPCGAGAMWSGRSGHRINVTKDGTTYCLGCTGCLKGISLPPAGWIRTGSSGSCQQADFGARALQSVTRTEEYAHSGFRHVRKRAALDAAHGVDREIRGRPASTVQHPVTPSTP